ncbi:hypothetical protein GB937_000371 [Aspergillus fischeri]|nr:hypothetical protein GB937_000371 [Aspergillus fischeri]
MVDWESESAEDSIRRHLQSGEQGTRSAAGQNTYAAEPGSTLDPMVNTLMLVLGVRAGEFNQARLYLVEVL